jgi:peptidoglycan/xylan/chitin deacetylase (PgdA/CDA1 family)
VTGLPRHDRGVDVTDDRPSFLITIDTEGDNLWAHPETVTTWNSRFLPRFQQLCELHMLRPTYLTTWEMAECPNFREFGADVIRRGSAEIGMHLHAWSTPPYTPLTEDDHRHMPYLIEYPCGQMAAKIERLTEKLEDTFDVRMTSHRAGRWGFDARYARLLADQGYRVDCSVTPHVSWKSSSGDPRRGGGPDYVGYPTTTYRLNLDDIRAAGSSPLVEVPVTTFPQRHPQRIEWARRGLGSNALAVRVIDRLFPRALWLRPDGRNGRDLPRLLQTARSEGREFVQFMLHSSELMPRGSPRFPSPRSVEHLYQDLERLFTAAAGMFQGRTLTEYRDHWAAGHATP